MDPLPYSPPEPSHGRADASFNQSDGEEDYSFQSEAPSATYDPDADASLASTSPGGGVGGEDDDSLANASFSEVEARALEFLASSPPASSTDAPSLSAGFDLLTSLRLPRKVPTLPAEQLEAQTRAVEFLRKRLEDAERDDWMYGTPAGFGGGGGGGAGERREAEGEGEVGWADQAFNVARYQVEEDWAQEDPVRFGEGVEGWGS
ncbi:hypothetical protein JCM10213_001412 [Rhodosporidiobolus nylandii]